MSLTNVYIVAGMTCGHCVQAVTSGLTKISGVRDVRVDLTTGEVTVCSDAEPSIAVVRETIDDAGFELVTKV